MEEIRNKVAESGLITLDWSDWYRPSELAYIDIKDWLFEEVLLREKDFRQQLKDFDWSPYQGKILHFSCSSDAIIPPWAYMLLAVSAQPYVKWSFYGTQESFLQAYWSWVVDDLDLEQFKDQRVILKGCGDLPVPDSAFLQLSARLSSVVKSLMFGEACSTVPVYKQRKK